MAAVSPAGKGSLFFKGSFSIRGSSGDDYLKEYEDVIRFGIEGSYLIINDYGFGIRYEYERNQTGTTRNFTYLLGLQLTVFPGGHQYIPNKNGTILPYFGAGVYQRKSSSKRQLCNGGVCDEIEYSDKCPEYRGFLGINVFLARNVGAFLEFDTRWYNIQRPPNYGDNVVILDESEREIGFNAGLSAFIW